MDLFGSGGGEIVSKQLSAALKSDVPLLGKIPFDVRLREGGDQGRPLVLDAPDAPLHVPSPASRRSSRPSRADSRA